MQAPVNLLDCQREGLRDLQLLNEGPNRNLVHSNVSCSRWGVGVRAARCVEG